MSDVDLQFNLSMSINSEHEEDQKESCSEEDMLFSEGEEGSFEDNSEDEKRLPLILTPSPPASVPAPETPPASVPAPVRPPASVPAPETPPRQRKSDIFDIDGFTPKCLKHGELKYQQSMRVTFEDYVDGNCNGLDNIEINDDDIKQIREQIFPPDSVIIDYIQKKKSKSIEEYTNIFLNMLKKNHNIFYRQQIEQRRQWAELRRRRAEQQRQQREQREQHRRRRRRKQEEKSEICATCTMQLQQLRF